MKIIKGISEEKIEKFRKHLEKDGISELEAFILMSLGYKTIKAIIKGLSINDFEMDEILHLRNTISNAEKLIIPLEELLQKRNS